VGTRQNSRLCRVGRAKPTIVINFKGLVGFAPLYPPYKKNVFMLNLMAFLLRVGTRQNSRLCRVGRAKPTIVINFKGLVGGAKPTLQKKLRVE